MLFPYPGLEILHVCASKRQQELLFSLGSEIIEQAVEKGE
jgi:hypothetical protein